MTKHSAGPWTWSRDESARDYISITDGHCEPVIYGECLNADADGPLLAAAPELLRLLIRLVNRCPGRMADPRYPAWHDDCCADARALIARVRGEVAP